MKIKTGEKLMWITAAVLVTVRVLQYIFVIGFDGFFVKETLGQALLSNSLYILLCVFAVLSLFVRFGKSKSFQGCAQMICTPQVSLAALVNAVLLAGYGLTLLLKSDWLCLPVLAAAVYFLLLYYFAKGKELQIMKYFAVGALAYPCARAIRMFFATFKEIKASENVIDMVTLCAMILMILALTKLCMGFDEKAGKTAWCFLLFGTLGVLTGVCKLFGLIWTQAADFSVYMAAVSDLAMWLTAMALYHAVASYQPKDEQESLEQAV